MHGHLITVEVGVERRAHERMDLDGLALDELWLKGLNAEAVQGRRPVEEHRMLGDDLLEDIPHDRARTLDHSLRALDVLGVIEIDEALHDERLEQLECHLLRKPALVELQLRSDDDDRTARVVDALAEQVLTEPALLALEHVGQRLQGPVARTGDGPATTTVVEECVNGLLKHALLVVDDDLRCAEVEQALQPVIAVDDAAVEVIEIGRRETATIKLHHRAQVRRDHRNGVEDHALRRVRCIEECCHDLQSLQRARLLLSLTGRDDLLENLGLSCEIERHESLLDRCGAHATVEPAPIAVTHLTEEHLVALEVLNLERTETIEHAIKALDISVGPAPKAGHLTLA